MRTITTTASLILFSLSSYATFTIDPSATYVDFNGGNSTTTTKVSGTCSVSDFDPRWPASMWLVDANITVEQLRLSASASTQSGGALSVSNGSGWYSVVCQGTNTITVANGGSLRIQSPNSMTVYDSDKTSSLTLTIHESAAADTIKKLFINNGRMLTANLYKENALGVDSIIGSACKGKHFELNMNCDQQLMFDFRDGTENAFNITNGAILTVSGWYNMANTSFIFADGLKNGGILFSDTSALWDFDSWDDSKAVFTITNADKTKEFAVSFVDDKGNKLDGLSFSKVEGGYLLTGMTSVPEPAEWAVILGSLALGLALYQRRK